MPNRHVEGWHLLWAKKKVHQKFMMIYHFVPTTDSFISERIAAQVNIKKVDDCLVSLDPCKLSQSAKL